MAPIEHVWRQLKEWVHDHHPELEGLTGNDEMIKDQMVAAIREAWNAIAEDVLENLIETIDYRIMR